MEFSYDAYAGLIMNVKKQGYEVCDYTNWRNYKKTVILRHDIDFDIDKAVDLAEMENKLDVQSTYFVLISTDFYNVFSKKNQELLRTIKENGHDIGLHFDETKYDCDIFQEGQYSVNIVKEKIIYELDLLSNVIGDKVTKVSYHRPSKESLNSNIEIPNVINSYDRVFFKEFKYLSDSRRYWREPVEEIINQQEYSKLHILTHPFWYTKVEKTMKESLLQYCEEAVERCYQNLDNNFTNLSEVLSLKDIK